MRALFHIAALAAAASLLTLSPAQAQPGGPQEAQATTSIQVPAPSERFRVTREDFKYYKGNYRLSNGRHMWISDFGRHFYAEVDGEPRVELYPVGYNVFVVRDSDRVLMFDQMYQGEINDVVIRARTASTGSDLAAIMGAPVLLVGGRNAD